MRLERDKVISRLEKAETWGHSGRNGRKQRRRPLCLCLQRSLDLWVSPYFWVCRVLEVWEGATSFRGVDEREVCPQIPESETASCKGRNPDKGPALVFRCDTGYSQRAEEKSAKY